MEVMPTHLSIPVMEASQPSAARFAAHDAARIAGFGDDDEHRAGLVATELATNLVKHAREGEILVRGASGSRAEVEIIAMDRGPGMADVRRSLADGHSTTGSPGTGLGAVRRLADEFDVHSAPGKGTVVLARLRPSRQAGPRQGLLQVSGVSVAHKGEPVCGDAWQLFPHADGVLAVVADGLGHGLLARDAAVAAIATIDLRREINLPALLEDMHAGIRHTRGAACAMADIQVRQRILKFAGVGNIAGNITRAGSIRHTVSLNGTLGHHARQFREYSYPWEPDALLVMHSDGLGTHWSLDDYPGLRLRHPSVIAAVLYRDSARQHDDVTVLVGRQVTSPAS